MDCIFDALRTKVVCPNEECEESAEFMIKIERIQKN